ncbi:MAG: hypothetical protein IKC65_03730 [Lentisphaeria bacterium]|nr:hypothetical protein [Lentisphaeria bacterium]
MNYNQLIKKLLAGEEINALERAELEKWDADALLAQHDSVIRERDQLKAEQQKSKRRQLLQDIADKYSCGETDFLDYLAARKEVDLENEEAVSAFIADMQQSSPHCFYSRVRSGGGQVSSPSLPAEQTGVPGYDRIGRIAASLVHAPEQK